MAETPRPGPQAAALIPDVKHTVAVSSGKGGVGKSTVAVNLALALKRQGHAVGLVDVDVYGPDVPLMMGTKGKPGMFENKIIPAVSGVPPARASPSPPPGPPRAFRRASRPVRSPRSPSTRP